MAVPAQGRTAAEVSWRWRRAAPAALAAACLALAVVGCADHPPPPDWLGTAKSAIDDAVHATLLGDSRTEAGALARARGEVARTGQPALAARVELMHCAARTASLDFAPCNGFERWRSDAAPAELAYADYLAGRPLTAESVALLPAAQRSVASASGDAARLDAAQAIDDAQARLIAIAVSFERVEASPAMIQLALDTASDQGWRRPLLAWLQVQVQRAEQAGSHDEAQRLRRRIALVESGGKAAAPTPTSSPASAPTSAY